MESVKKFCIFAKKMKNTDLNHRLILVISDANKFLYYLSDSRNDLLVVRL